MRAKVVSSVALLLCCVSRPATADPGPRAPAPVHVASSIATPAALPASWSPSKKAGIALVSVAGAWLIAGAILAALRPAQEAAILAGCSTVDGVRQCDAQGRAATSAAFALMHGSQLAFSLAGVTAAAGGGLLVLSPGFVLRGGW